MDIVIGHWELIRKHIIKQYQLVAKTKHYGEVVVRVEKSWLEDPETDDYDNDTFIINEEDIRDSFTDEEWDELNEFITSLK